MAVWLKLLTITLLKVVHWLSLMLLKILLIWSLFKHNPQHQTWPHHILSDKFFIYLHQSA